MTIPNSTGGEKTRGFPARTAAILRRGQKNKPTPRRPHPHFKTLLMCPRKLPPWPRRCRTPSWLGAAGALPHQRGNSDAYLLCAAASTGGRKRHAQMEEL